MYAALAMVLNACFFFPTRPNCRMGFLLRLISALRLITHSPLVCPHRYNTHVLHLSMQKKRAPISRGPFDLRPHLEFVSALVARPLFLFLWQRETNDKFELSKLIYFQSFDCHGSTKIVADEFFVNLASSVGISNDSVNLLVMLRGMPHALNLEKHALKARQALCRACVGCVPQNLPRGNSAKARQHDCSLHKRR